MSSDIRLRLTIRRHGLPEIKLVWPCTISEDLTVARLLSQVNEVVTLESGEWGLEDYVVELSDGQGPSFECLHFQQVGRVFKHDDQVVIRSLLSDDLRRRRVSGRHQISADGIHLVDGIPFGRRRAPHDRPVVSLPPRKRARITYDSDEDDDSDRDATAQPDRLLLEQSQPSAVPVLDGTAGPLVNLDDDEGDDQDYVSGTSADDYDDNLYMAGDEGDGEETPVEDDDDLENEVRLLQADNDVIGESWSENNDTESAQPSLPTSNGPHLLLQEVTPAAVGALQTAFPLTSTTTIHTTLQSNQTDIHRSYYDLAASNDPALGFDEVLERFLTERFETGSSPQPPTLFPEARNTSPRRPLIEEVESEPSAVDPTNGGSTETITNANAANSDPVDEASDDTSSSGESSESESEPSPGSNAGGDGGGDSSGSNASSYGGDSTNKSGKSDSSDSSDSDDDKDQSAPRGQSVESGDDGRGGSESGQSQGGVPGRTVGRGQGLSKTQKRNARRREIRQQRRLRESQHQAHQSCQPSLPPSDLLARKQALLDAVAEEATDPSQRNADLDESAGEETHSEENNGAEPASNGEEAHQPEAQGDQDAPENGQESASSPKDSVDVRRSRVDMGAGRRLLFGALGLKAPKSKADEDRLKESLMKDVQPLKNHRLEKSPEISQEAAIVESESGTEDWRDKIIYRAVECCREGIVLSEPPFPFVQRWDPQQQYGSMRKKKRKAQQLYDENHHDEASGWYEDANEAIVADRQSKKSKKKSRADQESPGANYAVELNYDDPPSKSRGADSQLTGVDDLPSLPADVSTLPSLQMDEVKAGMVITWKQLLLSKATNWQPEQRSLTGLVISLNAENVLHLILAKRDREQNDKLYDEETGQRIYDKFEMPGDSENEDDGEDGGYRDIPWSDLVEPRVVQGAPSPSALNSPVGEETGQAKLSESGVPKEGMNPAGPGPPDSSMNDADSMQIKAGIEKDLLAMATGGQHEVSGSSLIPSAQNIHHPTKSAPSVGEFSASNTSSKTENHKRQSREEAEVIIKDSQPAGQEGLIDSVNADESSPNIGCGDEESGDEEMVGATEVDPEPGLLEAATLSIGSASPDPEDEGESEVEQQTPAVDYPQLPQLPQPPTSVSSSIRSGRQPQSGHGPGESITADDAAIMPETDPSAQEVNPKTEADDDGSSEEDDDEPDGNSSPFPTLDEIWHTARTSNQIQSPLKSSQMSALGKGKARVNTEYEEAMRRLDEGEDSDEPAADRNKSIRSLFPHATQPSTAAPPLADGRPRRRSQRRSAPFQIPEGSQVITLSSSPPSSPVQENYAEDSLDETYEDERPSLPRGPGWVQKNRAGVGENRERDTRGRAKSMSSGQTRTLSGNKSLPPQSSAGPATHGFGRRRTMNKF
ncbi:hypothetical protein ACRE_072500 [Hapsidospora chrysogenum ATCC 11550]|uniref:DUF7357 domain-containing protein n=1 Tax=Hapsidospora chrysogenum (strain ATCC 11550 / CBS 779.69 / DSM 880 / IAM 14645 / JCM 23072 / IMI 49137) TaxID=857340 RepID=A0A086SY34_HAPC1|nr:hypothetical protein ACRE_072500 [Hapsidospora chrysogenum ATCC 11550]